MFQRIAIMGAGSLGTILGAHIAKNRQIDLIDANKAHVDALNKNGAKVVGFDEFTVPVKALTPDQMTGQYDLFFYMAKQLFNDVCFEQMKAHSHEKTIICTFQNGMPELAVAKAFGEEKVLGAPVNWGATFVEPGVSRLTSFPRTFAPRQRWPMSVCTRYAKSIGVDPAGRSITSPAGVNT